MLSVCLCFNLLWISRKVHKLFVYIDLSLRWQDQIWKIWVYAWFKYWLWLFTVDIYCTLPYHVVIVHGIWWFSRTNFNAVNNGALSWKRWKLCLFGFIENYVCFGFITVVPPETVKQLEQGAWRLAKCVNYIGAATVEYLYSMDSGEYYFLELNPRLQVYRICFSKHYEHGTNNVGFEFLVVLRWIEW